MKIEVTLGQENQEAIREAPVSQGVGPERKENTKEAGAEVEVLSIELSQVEVLAQEDIERAEA